jgi:hypothetical protein
MLEPGQEVLVQVVKEPLGQKGARITSHVSLPGRYLVFMPTVEHVGVSRKITDDDERRRLKTLLKELRQKRGGGGLIARTVGAGHTREDFERDMQYLSRTWDEDRAQSSRQRAPALLHRELSLVQRLLRDILSDDIANIRLDGEKEFQRTLDMVNVLQPELAPRVRLYNGAQAILEEFGVAGELERALRSKLWLDSGGYIVINQTEALVAIDINTGASPGRKPRGHDRQDQRGGGQGDRAPDPPARPGRDHRRGLHRHGGEEEPAEGHGRPRAGAEEGPLAVEGHLRERVRPRDPDPQARAPVPGADALRALPLLLGERHGEERDHGVLRDLRRGAQAGPALLGQRGLPAREPRRGARPARRRVHGAQGAVRAPRPRRHRPGRPAPLLHQEQFDVVPQ